MSEAFAYRLSFAPADANVSPEECLQAYCYETLVDAQMAAADDARANSANHANAKERPEWAAYATTAANICANALDGISTTTCTTMFPVDVRHGDNPRRIGAYRIVRLTEGDAMDCSTCENPGIVTYIGGRGNVIACCDDCREEDEKGERIRADFAAISTPPSATLPIHTTMDAIVDDAMHDAILSIQNALGITTGDYAGIHFSGEAGDTLRQILRNYAEGEGATIENTTPHTPFHSLRIRDRVMFVEDVERYPHFIAKKGFTGYVSRIIPQTQTEPFTLEVKCDQHLPNCEEWDNSVVWILPEDTADTNALARI